ncbi:MAG: DUF87 domain-containing protein [Clostridia bacterium]|nr:DUF87 domain-containing protein [Clostridia bacterium]
MLKKIFQKLKFFKNIKDKEETIIPKGVQDVIPVQKIWRDGIFLMGKNKYSKTFKFSDINYVVASEEDKETMFLDYMQIINSFESDMFVKFTILNSKLDEDKIEKNIKIEKKGDRLDKFREEYNKMIEESANTANGIKQEKYVTITIMKKDIDEARATFRRIAVELNNHFKRLNSKCEELNADDRLRLLHNFYRQGEESSYNFDMLSTMQKGHSFKDYICPDSFEFRKNCFVMGEKYCKAIFLKEYASFIKDSFISELTDVSKNLVLSIDIKPVDTDEAIKEAENRLLGIETNISNYLRKQAENNNYIGNIPFDMEQQQKESKEFLNDLMSRDQKMFLGIITILITADTEKELESLTDSVLTTARKNLCQFGILNYQQMDGLNTTLPIADAKIDTLRTLTTESLAVFMPFKVQEVQHRNGIYYGQNAISKNMILLDRKELLNGNSFILGVSGSGKSFTAKQEIASIMLKEPNADIIIIDPENEMSGLVKEFGGEVVEISSTSKNHINAMDMNRYYGDNANPIILKSEFILSLCEQLMGKSLEPQQRSIIDRCTAKVYAKYQKSDYQCPPPTLKDFREELLKQNEKEAKDVALAIELFSNGSLNTFAKQTNVNINNRLVSYNILGLKKQLQPIAMLVILDSIFNRITANRQKGKNTYIFIDEIYLLFQYEYSANFLFTLWKRVRKYGACCTGITQNVEDLLRNELARTMLANSELIIMLNQATTDRLELAKLLNISDEELSYITNVDAGHGLIKIGNFLIPFVNKFPKDTELYRLMTTKLNEVV